MRSCVCVCVLQTYYKHPFPIIHPIGAYSWLASVINTKPALNVDTDNQLIDLPTPNIPH